MTTISHAALTASVLVGLISIPAVSQTTTAGEEIKTDMPNISASESMPREVVKTTSANGFHASIETAFDSFQTSVTSDKINATLENAGSNLEVVKTPQRTEWELVTSQGTLEITESRQKTVEKVSTSEGTLEIKKKNGIVTESFEGTNREVVESTREELKQVLHQRKQKLDQKRKKLREGVTPDLDLIANRSTASGYGNNSMEHIVIENNDDEEVQLEGWKLENNNPETHTFGELSIPEGEKLHVFSFESEEVEIDAENAVYDTGLTWENGGDTARLLNENGVEVEAESY